MTDQFDKAQEVEQQQRDIALQRRFQGTYQPSRSHCIDCDEPIPQQRQQMVKGCQRCIDCQQQYEQRLKVYRK